MVTHHYILPLDMVTLESHEYFSVQSVLSVKQTRSDHVPCMITVGTLPFLIQLKSSSKKDFVYLAQSENSIR